MIMFFSTARPFWHMFLYFLRTIQYFLMKMCTDVLDITLTINSLFLTSCPSLLGTIFWNFWVYFFMFLYFQRTVQCFIMKLCTDVLGNSTLMVTSLKQMSCTPLLTAILGYFGAHVSNVPLFLENHSIYSHELLQVLL